MILDEPLLTVGDISEELGLPPHKIRYVLKRCSFEPVQRAGIIKLYDRATADRIRHELARIERESPFSL